MSLEGTIVNGQVQLDHPAGFPDGTRVRIEPAEEFEYPHPMAPYDQEKEVVLLRERIAEMESGVPGLTVEEAFAELDARLRKPV